MGPLGVPWCPAGSSIACVFPCIFHHGAGDQCQRQFFEGGKYTRPTYAEECALVWYPKGFAPAAFVCEASDAERELISANDLKLKLGVEARTTGIRISNSFSLDLKLCRGVV